MLWQDRRKQCEYCRNTKTLNKDTQGPTISKRNATMLFLRVAAVFSFHAGFNQFNLKLFKSIVDSWQKEFKKTIERLTLSKFCRGHDVIFA